MSSSVGSGYLTRTEANLVGVRAAPDVVFLRLVREIESENERTCMFTELTPGQAQELIKSLQEVVDIAISTSDGADGRFTIPNGGVFPSRA